MIRAVVDCDGCPQRAAAEAQPIYVPLPEAEDGAGRRHPPRLPRVDLCPRCLAAEVTRFVNRLPSAERRDWLRRFGAEEPPA
jgi:hypothetical protein